MKFVLNYRPIQPCAAETGSSNQANDTFPCVMSLHLQNVTFMATYLVVLMQFKLTLLRQAARQIDPVAAAAVNASTTAASMTLMMAVHQ